MKKISVKLGALAFAAALLTTMACAAETPASDVASESESAQTTVSDYEDETTADMPEDEHTADEPEAAVIEAEPVVCTYTYPEYTVPSTTPSFTWEYFYEIGQYLLLSGEEAFSVTFTGYTRNQLIDDTNYVDCRLAAADYLLGQHIDLMSFYSYVGYSYTEGDNTTFTFYLVHDENTYASASEVTASIEDFQSQVNELVTGFYESGDLKSTDSDMVVARYLYNWVCDNTVYGSNTDNPYSGYTTLTTGEGVCMGYAGLINAMYRTAGIECYGVGCSARFNGEGHTINCANLDGDWYYIDATFGDTAADYDSYFAMTRDTADFVYELDYKWAD
ncbi:MAG: transglutaminase-like domain-containing protein [Faecalibacterium sp.]